MAHNPIGARARRPRQAPHGRADPRPGVREGAPPDRVYNKDKVEHIADVVIEKKEIYGDELVRLLDGANLQIPSVDLTDEKAWPVAVSLAHAGSSGLAYLGLAALLGAAVGTFVVLVSGQRRPRRRRGRRGSRAATAALQRRAQIATHVGVAVPPPERQAARRRARRRPRPGTDPIRARRGREERRPAERRATFSDVRHLTTLDVHPLRRRSEVLDRRGAAVGCARQRSSGARRSSSRSTRSVTSTTSDSVVAFFPPGEGTEADGTRLLFTKDELSDQLDSPLRQTLAPARSLPFPATSPPPERKVDRHAHRSPRVQVPRRAGPERRARARARARDRLVT